MSEDIGKGKPTPSRKEAEAARKKAMKQPMTRKEAAKRERDARSTIRQKQQQALRGQGDEAYLPPRDRGPVKRFVRDFVDRRFMVAEYILPVLVLVLLASVLFPASAVGVALTLYFYPALIIAIAIDEVVMTRALKREVKRRFPDHTRGVSGYAVLRSFQLRRFRLPTPQVKRGDELPARY